MNKELRSELAAIARAEVGTLEVGGNNRGPRIIEYQKATWLKPGPWAWCMAFVCWCIQQLEIRLVFDDSLDFDRPRTASALGDHDVTFWARQEGLKVLGPKAALEEGDIAVYQWGHVGIVVEGPNVSYAIRPGVFGGLTGPEEFLAVEGNTALQGNTRDTESDGVFERLRKRSSVLHFIRLEKE